jgi:hypothetical protein
MVITGSFCVMNGVSTVCQVDESALALDSVSLVTFIFSGFQPMPQDGRQPA